MSSGKIHRSLECTSSAIQGLALFTKLYPYYRKKEIDDCISGAAKFMEGKQREDGSWFVILQHALPYLTQNILSSTVLLQQLITYFVIC